MDFTIPADNWGKINDSEKSDKYLDLAREIRKLWNMRLIRIPIGVFRTIPRNFERGMEEF